MQSDELMSHLRNEINEFVEGSFANYISIRTALSPSCAGLKLFEGPLIAVAAADDPLFVEAAQSSQSGSPLVSPAGWLPSATHVISYFLPMTERVRKSNYEGEEVSTEWLHACDEGKMFVVRLGEQVERIVRAAGYEAACPACHPEIEGLQRGELSRARHSVWSEYRAAYVSGLGTYSLSGGIITDAGTVGRFGSVVVSAPLPVTERPYTAEDEYCTKCATCVGRCPVGALSTDSAKDYRSCHEKMTSVEELYPGYAGCGKCKVCVPCEFKRP